MPIVTVIYKTLPGYRREFYSGLYTLLAEKNIELRLLYGQPSRRDMLKNDTIDLDWAIKVPSKIWEVGKRELYWQPVLAYLKDADLVIVEQASKLLVNYVLLMQNMLGIRKVAFWGHGKNMQTTSANGLAEWIKRQVSTRVHWWFAYNEMSARIVGSLGFPAERITCVQNAVDTKKLIRAFDNLSPDIIDRTRAQLNLSGNHVGIYVGGMYPEKHLLFLLEALHKVREKIPDFEMIFIGDGVDAPLIREAARRFSWIHYPGSIHNEEKVPYYAVSHLYLMPGLVGLGILDTFVTETPLVTCDLPIHSPEIDYLENHINGLMVNAPCSTKAYAEKVIELFLNHDECKKLMEGCRLARERYTIENMIERFSEGIIQALDL